MKKKCSKCGEFYDPTPDNFHASDTHKDGLGSWCKFCVAKKRLDTTSKCGFSTVLHVGKRYWTTRKGVIA